MDDGLAAARALLPGVRLEIGARIGGGERTSVHRVRAVHPDGHRQRLIVKQYHSAGEGWARESAALSILPGDAGGPRVVAVAGAPPLIVTDDLGPGPSVADALLATDPGDAMTAVVRWAEAVAGLHAATRHLRGEFRSALDAVQGDLPIADSPLAARLEDTVRVLERECGALAVRVPAPAFDELRGLVKRLSGRATAALSPADTCPDNNVWTGDRLVLVDFEDAQWRHLAWDAAYLTVPWPTCWCAWRLPDEVSQEALAAYRRRAGTAFPEVLDGGFAGEIEAATVGWALISTALFIDNALGSDPPLNPRRPTPSRRAMILHRLGRAAGSVELPAAAELAGRLRAALCERWGDERLAYAPAFRAPQ